MTDSAQEIIENLQTKLSGNSTFAELMTCKLDGSSENFRDFLAVSKGEFINSEGNRYGFELSFLNFDSHRRDPETGYPEQVFNTNNTEYFRSIEEACAAMMVRKTGNGYDTSAKIMGDRKRDGLERIPVSVSSINSQVKSDLENAFYSAIEADGFAVNTDIKRQVKFAINDITKSWRKNDDGPENEPSKAMRI